MIIAFTSSAENINSVVSNSFGRCENIIFYDTKSMNYSSVSNPYKDVFDDAGIQLANLIISKNVDIVITSKIGENAFRFLKYAGIKVFIVEGGTIEDNLNKFNNNQLNESPISFRHCKFKKRGGMWNKFRNK